MNDFLQLYGLFLAGCFAILILVLLNVPMDGGDDK